MEDKNIQTEIVSNETAIDNSILTKILRQNVIKAGVVILALGATCINTSLTASAVEAKSEDIKSRYEEYQEIKDTVAYESDIERNGIVIADNVSQALSATDLILEYNDLVGDEASSKVDTSSINKYISVGDSQIQSNIDEYKRQQKHLAIAGERARRGSMGRFSCPSVGLDVAVFNSSAQSVCDAADSACHWYANGTKIIADHVNQGFYKIKSMRPGTKCYFDDGTNITEYTVQYLMQGHNTGYDITDLSYNSLFGKVGFMLYTCNECWQNVTIVVLA